MRTVAVLVGLVLLAGCGGGGGGAGTPTFALFSVDPSVSNDLDGGDAVTITGSNFLAVNVTNVTFGNSPGFNLQVLGDTMLQVTVPPSPTGAPVTVTIEVFTVEAGSKFLANAFTYQSSASPPAPQTIIPTTYTATGAENFTIQGSNLGPASGTVQVTFAGVGTVIAQVSANATIVAGRAPLSAGAPPSGLVTVTVTNGALSGDVPTKVTYAYASPQSLGVANQTMGGASQPVRVAPGVAALCTAGANGIWRDGDDEIFLVRGPPNPVSAVPIRRSGTTPAGFLDAANSVPAVLDATTLCVYSVGLDGLPGTADDRVTLVTQATGANPVFTDHGQARLNFAPLARVSATRVAFTHAGADLTLGTNDDTLGVMTFSGSGLLSNTQAPNVSRVDVTPGRANRSIPFSPDGDAVFVITRGPDGAVGTLDDSITRLVTSTGQTLLGTAPAFAGGAVAISPSLVVGPSLGPNLAAGGGDDALVVIQPSGGILVPTPQILPSSFVTAALAPFARVGAGAVAVPCVGADGAPNTNPDDVVVYTDPVNNVRSTLSVAGQPLLVGLANGELIVVDRGPNLLPNSGDETTRRVDAAAMGATNFLQRPIWSQAFVPLADAERLFAIGAGPDGTLGTGDEQLLVFQTRALGATIDAVALPLALPPAPVNPPPLGVELPFVPVGPGWGLMQSPGIPLGGPTPAFGDANDSILLVAY